MPDVTGPKNLSIFQGKLSFKKDGEAVFRDLGEAPEFTLQPNIEKKDYQSSRTGMRTKVREVAISTGGTVSLQLDEITRENLALYFYGSLSGDVVKLLDSTEVVGVLKFEGTNIIGKRCDYEGRVSLTPSDAFAFLTSGEWANMKLSGELLLDTTHNPAYPLGKLTVHDEAAA